MNNITSRRPLLRHLAIVTAVFALVGFGFVLTTRHEDGQLVSVAAAAAGDHLQISQNTATPVWGSTIGSVFTKPNLAPGDTFSGSLKLKRIGGSVGNTTLRVRADMTGASIPSLASQLKVTSMKLGTAELASLWPAACQPLTLATLNSCATSPFLGPPDTVGQVFTIALKFDPASGNSYQAKNAGSVTLVFTLNDTTPDGDGRFVINNNLPSGFSPGDFTLSVSGPNGVSGPGATKSVNKMPVNQQFTVSVSPIQKTSGGKTIHVVNATCVSSAAAGTVTSPLTAGAFQTQLTVNGETKTCTFNWAAGP